MTSSISFKVGIDEEADPPTISFNGETTEYTTGYNVYKAVTHYVHTLRDSFSYKINYPATTSTAANMNHVIYPETNYLGHGTSNTS